jgi:hypothetical protein
LHTLAIYDLAIGVYIKDVYDLLLDALPLASRFLVTLSELTPNRYYEQAGWENRGEPKADTRTTPAATTSGRPR